MSVESKIQELLEQAEELNSVGETQNEDLSLTEEDLDLFSEDELNELIENFEQLDELSKQTLGNYLNGNVKDRINIEKNGRDLDKNLSKLASIKSYADKDTRDNLRKAMSSINATRDRNIDKENKRIIGFHRAVNKLTKEDIGSLFDGEDLTEEFKNKAATIFESAVAARVTQEIERVTEELIEANDYEVALFKEGLIDKIDGYLSYITEQWMQKNELALERGVKADLFESLVSSMKNVFTEHYITVPEEQLDVLEDTQDQIEELRQKLDESTAHNVALSSTLREISKNMQIEEASEGLSEIQAEKFRALVENIAYDDEDSFVEKLETIKENYFSAKESVKQNRVTFVSDAPVENLTEETINSQLSPEMKAYTQLLNTK